jgi:hypothetical protein
MRSLSQVTLQERLDAIGNTKDAAATAKELS